MTPKYFKIYGQIKIRKCPSQSEKGLGTKNQETRVYA